MSHVHAVEPRRCPTDEPLHHQPHFLQQVRLNGGAHKARPLELHDNEFAKPGRVFVAQRLCVAKRLQQRVGGQDFVGDFGATVSGGTRAGAGAGAGAGAST